MAGKTMRVTFALVCLMCFGGQVFAQTSPDHSGNRFLPGCKAVAQEMYSRSEALLCLGFIEAARSYTMGLPDHVRSCTPVAATNGQVVRVVVKFLEDNPRRLHESFVTLVAESLKAAWPCK